VTIILGCYLCIMILFSCFVSYIRAVLICTVSTSKPVFLVLSDFTLKKWLTELLDSFLGQQD